MRHRIAGLLSDTKKHLSVQSSLVFGATLLSILTWFFSYRQGLVMIYNDSMSHLNISRFVIDNLQPGLAQLGGVWLPLGHVLPLLLIWNEWAWHSGFAGSFFSMVSFVVSIWAIYDIVLKITSDRKAGVVAAIAFALNANMLYLQTTPLTEPLYVMLFSLSVVLFTRWLIEEQTFYLPLLGLFGFFSVLTRYDGWIVCIILAFLIGFQEFVFKRHSFTEAVGKMLIYFVPVIFGIGLWILWNILIFKDPLFFAFGAYSAKTQQQQIDMAVGLVTKGNLLVSTQTFLGVIALTMGSIIGGLSIVGLCYMYYKSQALSFGKKHLFNVYLISPIIFNIAALFFGFSIVSIPMMFSTAPASPSQLWFNVRYGVIALPAIAVWVGMLAHSRQKIAALLLVLIVVLQLGIQLQNGVVTIIDGTSGSSAFRENAIAKELRDKVSHDEILLLSLKAFNPVLFESKLPLNHIVHEGVRTTWPESLDAPERHVEWILMAKSDPTEPVHHGLVVEHKSSFLSFFTLEYDDGVVQLYHRKKLDLPIVIAN